MHPSSLKAWRQFREPIFDTGSPVVFFWSHLGNLCSLTRLVIQILGLRHLSHPFPHFVGLEMFFFLLSNRSFYQMKRRPVYVLLSCRPDGEFVIELVSKI
jgi:hypothetical protein